MDDDLAWKVDLMFDYLSKIDTAANILYCLPVKYEPATRDVRKQMYVSKDEYPYKFFPEYCLSPIYAATPSTVAQLAYATNTIPLVWLDDVWSNGIVAAEIGAKFRLLPSNPDHENFEPFLNGSAITQFFKAKEDGPMLFELVNGQLLS
ncbi:Hexosyltransferase [Trichostrongylus colubriformis]|uniref:Hexosyltransferase n=1 Tax=Trichostrongylus colubriformis TaxID=6319 RepID=A0AAN8FPA0_TRICO